MSTVVITAVEMATLSMTVADDLIVHGATGTHARSEFAIVRVRTSAGTCGHGEVSGTAVWSGEDAVTARHVVTDLIRPALVGQSLTPIAALAARMDAAVAGHPFTKAGVSTALWDALGRTVDLPVVELLGGPFRREVPVKVSISGDADGLQRAVTAARSRGFEAFKAKVGFSVDADLERLATARRLIGESAFLCADANTGWSRSAASRMFDAAREFGLAFLEQPLAAGDLAGLRDLRGRGLPVVLDESVYSMSDLAKVVQSDAADAISVYVGKSGGLEQAVALGRVAQAFGIDVIVGSNLETDLGAAAQLHVACALAGLSAEFPSDIAGPLYYTERRAKAPVDINGVRAVLPSGPGLGVEPPDDLEFL